MRTLIVFSLLMASLVATAQLEKKITEEGVIPGVIIKGGKEISGYFKRVNHAYENGKTFPAPWRFQDNMKFMEKGAFEKAEKIKNKMYEEFEPKDLDGYRYDTMIFESVKFADLTAVGVNMIPRRIFLRKIEEGKISLFLHYDSPPGIAGPEGFEPYYIECNKGKAFYRKGVDGKIKAVNDLNIEKELADCPKVVEKHKQGGYKVVGKEGEGSGANKLLNNTLFREEVRWSAIQDYNQNCN